MENKIGILTFQDSINYGAILQVYALQTYLSDLGFDVEIINYCNSKRRYAQIKGVRKYASILWHSTIGLFVSDKKRKRRTIDFKNNYLKLTQIMKTKSSLTELNSKFNVFITGSDQVWNKRNNGGDLSYFLDFVYEEGIKMSYAPSFGKSSITDDYANEIEDLLRKIQYISIREISGKNILQERFGINSKLVCDPIFLLDESDWKKLLFPMGFDEHYILCYYMPGDKEVENKILEVSKKIHEETGYNVINIGKKDFDRKAKFGRNIFGLGPKEFLNAIYYADYVITNSFHGTAFSIIFNKTLVVPFNNKKIGGLNTRLLELIKYTKCENCLVSLDDEYSTSKAGISSEMGVLIKESKDFLRRTISNGNL